MPTGVEAYLISNQTYLYPTVFFLLLIAGLGFPVSADLVLLVCSYLVYTGDADYIPLIIVSTLGILLSDTIMFYVGKKIGFRMTQVWPLKKVITEDRIKKVKQTFQAQGYKIVFVARFMPGIRTVFMFTSGLMKLNYWKFISYDLAGALVVIPSMLYSMKWLSGNKEVMLHYLHRFQWLILFLVIGWIFYRFFKLSKTRKNTLSR